jgi:hypothetical protein
MAMTPQPGVNLDRAQSATFGVPGASYMYRPYGGTPHAGRDPSHNSAK